MVLSYTTHHKHTGNSPALKIFIFIPIKHRKHTETGTHPKRIWTKVKKMAKNIMCTARMVRMLRMERLVKRFRGSIKMGPRMRTSSFFSSRPRRLSTRSSSTPCRKELRGREQVCARCMTHTLAYTQKDQMIRQLQHIILACTQDCI